jgi:hypothetical protein
MAKEQRVPEECQWRGTASKPGVAVRSGAVILFYYFDCPIDAFFYVDENKYFLEV